MKIGIIDTGIDPTYLDFLGRIDSASGDVGGSGGLSDQNGHGTAVSSIAAAARNDQNQHGVAFGATIVSMRADTPGSCPSLGESRDCSFTDSALAAAVNSSRSAGARVINLSLAGDNPGPQLITAVDAATKAGIVVVVAAGNSGETTSGAQPDRFAAGLAQLAGNGLVIIAGSVGVADANSAQGVDLSKISTFSNRAGSLGQSYLTALGHRLVAPNNQDGNRPYYWTGTSFSAPVISGAVALLAQGFPSLTGQQIVSILYRTADDLGAAGVDGVFGHGRLNIARAFEPVGATGMAGSGAPISIADNGKLPAASGDARLGTASAVILDEYARPFRLTVAGTVASAERESNRLARVLGTGLSLRAARAGGVAVAFTVAGQPDGSKLQRLGLTEDSAQRARILAGRAITRIDDNTAVALGFSEGAKGLERELTGGGKLNPFIQATDPLETDAFRISRGASFALRHRMAGLVVTVSAEQGRALTGGMPVPETARYDLVSTTVGTTLNGVRLAIGASQLREERTVLGGSIAPVLAEAGANTRFLDAEVASEFGRDWSGRLLYRRGWTSFAGDDGRLGTQGWAVELLKASPFIQGDRLGFRLSQPLRVEAGNLTKLLPDSYDWQTRDVSYKRSSLNFAPRGRELAAEAAYWLPFSRGWVSTNVFYRNQPGHWRDAPDDVGAVVRVGLGF